MSRYKTIALLDEISALDSVRSYEPYLRALQQAVEALNDQSAEIHEAMDPFCEPTLERRAWELLGRGAPNTLLWATEEERTAHIQSAFDIAEMFAAEAAKRRGGS